MRPISLAELVERAELLTRVDRKYLIPVADLPTVLDALPAETRVLEIDGRRAFAYRSAYFDTPGLDSYLGAARGRRRRFKLRIRTYVDSDLHFFEVKTRGSRGTTEKQRIPYAGSLELSPDATAHAGNVLGTRLDLDHVLTTFYRRATYFLPTGGARVTVDTRLAWELPDGSGLHTPGWAIVETKSGSAASAADRLLWSLHHRPRRVSKYGTGLAALRPELPANRWHPVLRLFHATASRPLAEARPTASRPLAEARPTASRPLAEARPTASRPSAEARAGR